MPLKGTIESRITYRIKRSKEAVFMRDDFKDIGGYDQVGRILKQMIAKEIIINLGYGLYARTRKSSLNGKMIPEKSLQELTQEALKKLGVKTVPTQAEQVYNRGQSTQVPTGRVVGVKGRISRRIGYDGKYVAFEKHA